jgi:hypothetical protein
MGAINSKDGAMDATILAGISGAIVAGMFALLGAAVAARSARRQIELQHRVQQRESIQHQRENLYLDILAWTNRVNVELVTLPETRDLRGFLCAVKDSSSDFVELLPRLQLFSSATVVEVFGKMNNGVQRFLGVLQPGDEETQGITGDQFVEAYADALDAFLRQTDLLVSQMKTDLGIAGSDLDKLT